LLTARTELRRLFIASIEEIAEQAAVVLSGRPACKQ
jgi:hypothetical protein